MKQRNWVCLFITLSIIGLIPRIISQYWLSQVYENNSYESIASKQIQNDSIYGTSLNYNSYKYKLKLIEKIKPKVISLGSSRVMQFREEFFNVPFVNAGGAMNHLSEGVLFVDEMLKYHKPDHIILGLDFWWFNDQFKQPKYFPYHLNDGKTMNWEKVISPYLYIFNGKVKLSSIKSIFEDMPKINQYTNYENLGFSAMRTSDGFRKDGSYLYSKTIFGIEKSRDAYFKDTISRIKKGNKRFEYGDRISIARKKIASELFIKIIENNINLIIIIPPVANTINSEMKNYNKNYKYINDFVEYVSKLNILSFNYHDLSKLTNDDCECIDGFHGGDVIYQRILFDIYNSKKDLFFNNILNIDNIINNIDNYKGKVLSKINNKYNVNEVDFLELGCQK